MDRGLVTNNATDTIRMNAANKHILVNDKCMDRHDLVIMLLGYSRLLNDKVPY
jgi:hypothetical protein